MPQCTDLPRPGRQPGGVRTHGLPTAGPEDTGCDEDTDCPDRCPPPPRPTQPCRRGGQASRSATGSRPWTPPTRDGRHSTQGTAPKPGRPPPRQPPRPRSRRTRQHRTEKHRTEKGPCGIPGIPRSSGTRTARPADQRPARCAASDLLHPAGTNTTRWPSRPQRAAPEGLPTQHQPAGTPSTVPAGHRRGHRERVAVPDSGGTRGWPSKDRRAGMRRRCTDGTRTQSARTTKATAGAVTGPLTKPQDPAARALRHSRTTAAHLPHHHAGAAGRPCSHRAAAPTRRRTPVNGPDISAG